MQKLLPIVLPLFVLTTLPLVGQETQPASKGEALKVAQANTSKAEKAKPAEAVKPEVKPVPPARKVERTAFAEKPEASAEASGKKEAGDAAATGEEASPKTKRSIWEKIFGQRKATPAPATPMATPKATPRPRRVRPAATPAPDEDKKEATPSKAEKSVKPEAPEPKGNEESKEPAKVESADSSKPVAPTAMATPAPKKSGKGKSNETAATNATSVPPLGSAEAEVQEKYKYSIAKAQALTDPNVLKLKEKSESAVNEEEARKAQREYTKALFNKMRSIDSSIKERADRIEAGILRRLNTAE